MKSTLTSKGRTTIPKAVRVHLQLGQGVEIDWRIQEEGAAVVRLARPTGNPFGAFPGAFPPPGGQTTAEVVRDVRGERDPLLEGGPGARILSSHDFLTARA